MRHATARRRRTDYDGARLLFVVCPLYGSSHWVPDAPTATCPRRPGTFAVRKRP